MTSNFVVRGYSEEHDIICPTCGLVFSASIWLLVNTKNQPEECEKMLDDTFHQYVCPHCSKSCKLDAPLLLIVSDKWTRLIFVPQSQADENQRNQTLKKLMELIPFDEEFSGWDPSLVIKTVIRMPEEYLPVLLQKGYHAAQGLMIADTENYGNFVSLINDILDIPSWLKRKKIFVQNPWMLSYKTVWVLRNLLDDAEEKRNYQTYEDLHILLQFVEDSLAFGLDGALDAYLTPDEFEEAQLSFPALYQKMEGLDDFSVDQLDPVKARETLRALRVLCNSPRLKGDRKARACNQLCMLLTRQAGIRPYEKQIDLAIDYQFQAITLTHRNHPDRYVYYWNLAKAYLTRYVIFHDYIDIGLARNCLNELLGDATPGDALLPPVYNMLGHLEDLSMSPFSDRTDFLTAAGLFQQAFALSSEEDSLRTKNLEDLAAVMYKSYKAFDQQTDLEDALNIQLQVVSTAAKDTDYFPESLMTASMYYKEMYFAGKRVENLNDAISIAQDATNKLLSSPRAQKSYSELAKLFLLRYDISGDADDLEHAIDAQKEALKHVKSEGLLQAACMIDLAETLGKKIQHTGDYSNFSLMNELLEHAKQLNNKYGKIGAVVVDAQKQNIFVCNALKRM